MKRSHTKLIHGISEKRFFLDAEGTDPDRVLEAMAEVDRRYFLQSSFKDRIFITPLVQDQDGSIVYRDEPILIDYGQTCSSPYIVATMAVLLDLQPGMNVLEIGTGCGYATAVTSRLVGREGKVVSIERIKPLATFARSNLEKHFGEQLEDRVTLLFGDGSEGCREHAPYDRIYFTAGVDSDFNPRLLAAQLQREHGILLYPSHKLGPLMKKVYRNSTEEKTIPYGEASFVPLLQGVEEQ